MLSFPFGHAPAWALSSEKRPPLFGVPDHFPPMIQTNNAERPEGWLVDLLRAALKGAAPNATPDATPDEVVPNAAPDLRFAPSTIEEALACAKIGRCDAVAPITPEKARRRGLAAGVPFHDLEWRLFRHEGLTGVKHLDDLAGVRIGVVKDGLEFEPLVERIPFGAVLVEYPDFHDLVRGAVLGEVGVFFAPYEAGVRRLEQLGESARFRVGEVAFSTPLVIGVNPNRTALFAALGTGLFTLGPQGVAEIIAKAADPTPPVSPLVKRLTLILAGLVAVCLLFLGWSADLKRRVRSASSALLQKNDELTTEIDLRKAAQAVSAEKEAWFRDLFDCSPLAALTLDADNRITAQNEAHHTLFGFDDDRVLGRKPSDLVQSALEREQALHIETELAAGRDAEVETDKRNDLGQTLYVRIVAFAVHVERERRGACLLFVDMTRARSTQLELSHISFHDRLTGLPNRALFMDRLDQLRRKTERSGGRFGVLFIDLDRFKAVNDSLGHAAGDALLKAVADRIKRAIRDADTAARLGGDEFGVLLEGASGPLEVVDTAKRILAALADPLNVGTALVHPRASIGARVGPDEGANAETLLGDADIAMYRAKEAGKARVELFTEAMRAEAASILVVEADLRRGLDRDEFRPAYQRIVCCRTGEVVGFEALVRREKPGVGIIAPDLFISRAEETGLIVPLGRRVLHKALNDLKILAPLSQGPRNQAPLFMSVNLSAREFNAPDLVESTALIAAEAGVSPDRLKLEITESVLMDNASRAEDQLFRLKELGVSIAVDDFGTGYSSLSYLHRFPIDTLKIDRSFVRRMHLSMESRTITAAVVGLAHNLGLGVVAEGVETVEQLEMLKRMDCDHVQGFYFSKPRFLLDMLTEMHPNSRDGNVESAAA